MSRTASLSLVALLACACDGRREADPYDLHFDVPGTEAFADSLAAYGLYEEPGSLEPAPGVTTLELSSDLFTDYAYKQRLLKVPDGTSVTRTGEDGLSFPEGTVLSKTFFYPQDMSDPESASQVIETRLLVKTDGLWNAATYLWNDEQTAATLLLEGTTTRAEWVDAAGRSRSTDYAVPHEGECYTCHQADGAPTFIGPSLANLNRPVERDGTEVDQLAFLAGRGSFEGIEPDSAPSLPSYKDASVPLAERARAYLQINCAHCHNPGGWDEVSDRDMDFRYTTPLDQTGLARKAQDLERVLTEGQMPYLGTTMVHDEGVELVLEYVSSL